MAGRAGPVERLPGSHSTVCRCDAWLGAGGGNSGRSALGGCSYRGICGVTKARARPLRTWADGALGEKRKVGIRWTGLMMSGLGVSRRTGKGRTQARNRRSWSNLVPGEASQGRASPGFVWALSGKGPMGGAMATRKWLASCGVVGVCLAGPSAAGSDQQRHCARASFLPSAPGCAAWRARERPREAPPAITRHRAGPHYGGYLGRPPSTWAGAWGHGLCMSLRPGCVSSNDPFPTAQGQ